MRRAPALFVRRRHGIGDRPLAFRMRTKASEDGIIVALITYLCSCVRGYGGHVSWATKEAGKPRDDNDMTGVD